MRYKYTKLINFRLIKYQTLHSQKKKKKKKDQTLLFICLNVGEFYSTCKVF